jgi:hypothetical protein
MSRKKRKTRSQKEALGLKARRTDIVSEGNTIVDNETETLVQSEKIEKAKTADWVSDKINKDFKNVLLFIGLILLLVAITYILMHKTDLLDPVLNRFNISY